MDRKFIAIFIFVIVIGILVRSITYQYNTFLEPDVFVYYSVAQQTLANHLHLTSTLSSLPYDESSFLIYLPIAFSYVFGSLKTAFLILPILAAVGEMILVYMVSTEITENKWAGLFSMFLFSIIVAAILKNSVGEWRGETIVPLFQVFGAWLVIKGFKAWPSPKGKVIIYFILGGLVWILTIFTWNGGIYVIGIIGIIALLIAINKATKSLMSTIAIVSVILSIGTFLIYYFVPYLFGITNNLASTILEVQTPTLEFILGAYGLILPFCIIGMAIIGWEIRQQETKTWKEYAFYVVLGGFMVTFALQFMQIRFEALVAIPMCIFGGIGLEWIYYALKSDPKIKITKFAMFIVIIALLITFFKQVPTYSPADAINPNFTAAMSWMAQNTPKNSTVLTFWPDGSVVEAIGERYSYTDSVMGLNTINIESFARYLVLRAGNEAYINQTKPDYIVARTIWKYEAQAIGEEAGLGNNCTYPIPNTTKTSCNLNGTNMGQLISANAPYPIVFQNNDTIIYKVK